MLEHEIIEMTMIIMLIEMDLCFACTFLYAIRPTARIFTQLYMYRYFAASYCVVFILGTFVCWMHIVFLSQIQFAITILQPRSGSRCVG